MEKKRPWMKWYPADWRADPRLRMCSLAARGLWADLISYMHEGEPYGHLTIDNAAPDLASISSLVARPIAEVKKALAELEDRNVASRTEDGVLYSRRMVRDYAKANRDRENGKGGGNPTLTGKDKRGVNPPDKAQKPEARSQNKEAAADARAGLSHWGAWVRIAEAIGADRDDPNWFSQHGRVAQWLADGWDLDLDILPTLTRIVARRAEKSSKPIRRLEFFEDAIADAKAARLAPIPVGSWETHHAQANQHQPDKSALGAIRRIRQQIEDAAGDRGEAGGNPVRSLSQG